MVTSKPERESGKERQRAAKPERNQISGNAIPEPKGAAGEKEIRKPAEPDKLEPDAWYYVKKKYKLKVNFSYNLLFFIQPIFPSYSISVHTHSRIHLVIDIHNDCGFLPYYKMSLCIQIPIYRHVHNFLF